MLEVLRFVFSSFWIWLGSALLLALIMHDLCALIERIRGKKDSGHA